MKLLRSGEDILIYIFASISGQLVRLKDMRIGREFCIANTHLLFNKRRGDVKLAQLAVLLANIDHVSAFFLSLMKEAK